MSRVYIVRRKKTRMGNEVSLPGDLAFERCTRNYNGEGPLPRVERTIPESLDGFWDCVAKASRGERYSEVNCELATRSRRHNR
jgi:hypothetical protein